jgi:hypothetical protein
VTVPKTTKDLPIVVGFRCTAADQRKLNALAELTCRRPAEVLRLLLRRAVLKGEDVIIAEPFTTPAPDEAQPSVLASIATSDERSF